MDHAKVTFDEPLCGCFSDWTSCLIVTFVPFGDSIGQAMAVDNARSQGLIVPCLLSSFLLCIGGAINRAKVREAYEIQGNFCGDCCIHLWCRPCAICQEYRQALRKQGKVF